MRELEADYLVIGAGASGLAFTDALIVSSAADVIMVDRRERPGGHWQDAYSFLRLHQASSFYGVNSRRLGEDRIETRGPNAGLYECATAAEVRAYFEQVLEHDLLQSGGVRFLGMHEHVGTVDGRHAVVSKLTGERFAIRARRRVVDARYLEASVPATHTRGFEVGAGAHVVPVAGLAAVEHAFEKYVLLGSGKTAMDACGFLLAGGVPADRIQWIRPRDAWMNDRAGWQPLEQVGATLEGFSLDVEAVARAESLDDLFLRLEATGRLIRIDPAVRPTMYRCATVSQSELAQLRSVEDVVRLGRVRRIEERQIILERGTVPTGPTHLHVDCTAAGTRVAPPRPVFEPDRVTLQQLRACSPAFNAALTGYVEATRNDVEEQNRLCPPTPQPSTPRDWLLNFATQSVERVWRAEPDINEWIGASRLNVLGAVPEHLDDPRIQASSERSRRHREEAATKLPQLLAGVSSGIRAAVR